MYGKNVAKPVHPDPHGWDVVSNPQKENTSDLELGDLRFRRLLGNDQWDQLPMAIRKRFSKRLAGAKSVTYSGEVKECHISKVGMFLANILRPIGAPLPLRRDTGLPAVVTVTEDVRSHGQIWSRQYGNADHVPQVIHSVKNFGGPTGLQEHIGGGLGVALKLAVRDGGLYFLGDHYFWKGLGIRIRLPAFLSPGELSVGHIAKGSDQFDFTLSVKHRWLGVLIEQRARFCDPASNANNSVS